MNTEDAVANIAGLINTALKSGMFGDRKTVETITGSLDYLEKMAQEAEYSRDAKKALVKPHE